MKRHGAGLLLIALLALPLAAQRLWGGGDVSLAGGGGGDALVITSPHRREVRLEFTRAFRAHYREATGRDVNLVWLDVGGGTSAILKDLRTRFERTPDDPGVDLLFGGGSDPYIAAAREGWLQPRAAPAEALAGIPSTLMGLPVYDDDAGWYGVALSGFGIIYHQDLLDRLGLPAPTAWEELADPRYFGWIANVDPGQSGAAHACFETVLQSRGWDAGWSILTRMAANTRVFGDRASAPPNEVSAGDAAAGMAIDQYAITAIQNAGNPAVRFVLPPGQTLVNPDAIGMIRNAPHPEAARLFLAFALSPAGQRLLYAPPGADGQRFALRRNPVLPALYAGDPELARNNPYAFTTDFRYDGPKASRRWNVVNALSLAWFIETRTDLARAWRAVLRRGARPEEVARLTAPPCSEAEALRLAADEFRDPARAMALRRAWAVAARDRYRGLW